MYRNLVNDKFINAYNCSGQGNSTLDDSSVFFINQYLLSFEPVEFELTKFLLKLHRFLRSINLVTSLVMSTPPPIIISPPSNTKKNSKRVEAGMNKHRSTVAETTSAV